MQIKLIIYRVGHRNLTNNLINEWRINLKNCWGLDLFSLKKDAENCVAAVIHKIYFVVVYLWNDIDVLNQYAYFISIWRNLEHIYVTLSIFQLLSYIFLKLWIYKYLFIMFSSVVSPLNFINGVLN